jgi:hypothetical protein
MFQMQWHDGVFNIQQKSFQVLKSGSSFLNQVTWQKKIHHTSYLLNRTCNMTNYCLTEAPLQHCVSDVMKKLRTITVTVSVHINIFSTWSNHRAVCAGTEMPGGLAGCRNSEWIKKSVYLALARYTTHVVRGEVGGDGVFEPLFC